MVFMGKKEVVVVRKRPVHFPVKLNKSRYFSTPSARPAYSDGATPYAARKHLAKYDRVLKPTS
jgi:hypothetical protein